MPAHFLRLRRAGAALVLAAAVACAPSTSYWAAGPDPFAPPPGMSGEAWTHALAAHHQASLAGQTAKSLLTVIDYSLPSDRPRLWVVDLATGEVLLHDYVAHAVRSGGRWATTFSNDVGSYQSSLGTFLTGRSYVGIRGLSLRLDGLEPGINYRARARGIVIHGSSGVNAHRAGQGRLGRTEGCPAVPMATARRLVRLIEGGVVVFAWYPDRRFLARSTYVDPGSAAIRLSSSN